MNPKTQSVCKHCPNPEMWHGHQIDSLTFYHPFEPVAEPASTGEPTPTASEIKTMAECVHLGWLRSREEGAQELLKAVFALRAARPPEPSAPQAISGMYISETKPHKVEIFNREPVSDPAPSPTPSVSTEPGPQECIGFDVAIRFHSADAPKAMNTPETVRMAIGRALDGLRIAEEIDYTLEVKRAY